MTKKETRKRRKGRKTWEKLISLRSLIFLSGWGSRLLKLKAWLASGQTGFNERLGTNNIPSHLHHHQHHQHHQ